MMVVVEVMMVVMEVMVMMTAVVMVMMLNMVMVEALLVMMLISNHARCCRMLQIVAIMKNHNACHMPMGSWQVNIKLSVDCP